MCDASRQVSPSTHALRCRHALKCNRSALLGGGSSGAVGRYFGVGLFVQDRRWGRVRPTALRTRLAIK